MIEKKDIPLFISFDSKCSFKYEIRENIYEIYDIFTGTGCYIINKTAAKLLLRIFPIKSYNSKSNNKIIQIDKYSINNTAI